MKIPRLKIFQQFLIVIFIAVLLPLFISTLVVTNVNQHAVRAELQYSAIMTADKVYRSLKYAKLNKEELFKFLTNDKRQVYIIDRNNKIVMSYNGNEKTFANLLPDIPKNYNLEQPLIFGPVKNQPNVIIKISEPDWAIIVVTPQELINYGIINARSKIITATVVAAATIIILGILYTVSLNANFKQLFKAISAIAAGNYRRKIRLIRDFFTPYEFVYLIEKFNEMAGRINESYSELSKLDRLKSNLIDTVSHEFRTPLTSIRGYTSSLLRNDLNIDEETRVKSLKIIKQQTDRISRLVDDLLVVPQIESALLRIFPEKLNLRDVLEDCILSVQHKQTRKINLEIAEDFPNVLADTDRLMQVVINLLDNALKYSPENSNIEIKVEKQDKQGVIRIKNECETISEDKLEHLFEKFTRLDDNLTRTTRGTGLGLFIVKGLVQAMGGEIALRAENCFEVNFTLPLATE